MPDVSINQAFKNDASSPKKKGLQQQDFQDLKAFSHFGIRSDTFKLLSNMCLSLGPINYDRKGPKTNGKRALIYSSRMGYMASHERPNK